MEHEAFRYDPLPSGSIRLFKVQTFEPLIIRFTQCSLSALPEYYVLSYSWGSSLLKQDIFCDGAYILISHNLFELLKHLNHATVADTVSGHWLWVDSICINQEDYEEKSHQIRMMARIAELAKGALCWVNVSISPSCVQLITRLMRLASSSGVQRHMDQGTNALNSPDRILPVHLKAYRIAEAANFPNSVPSLDVAAWQDIATLLRSDYFSRRWIYLDFINTQNPLLVTQTTTLCLLDLCHALRFATLHMCPPVSLPVSLSTIITVPVIRGMYHESNARCPTEWWPWIYILAMAGCHFLHTDKRDYLYSAFFLRRYDDARLNSFLGRYNRDTSSVMNEATEFMNSTLNTLVSLSQGTDPMKASPSHVWDFSLLYEPYILGHPSSSFRAYPREWHRAHDDEFFTPRNLQEISEPQNAKEYTGIFGAELDRIGSYLPPRRFDSHYNLEQSNNLVYLDWLEMIAGTDTVSACTQSLDFQLGKFAETIHARGCNHLWEMDQATSSDTIVRLLRSFLGFFESEGNVASDEVKVFYAACYPSHGRRFGITTDGRFCLIPKASNRGDLICIPKGHKVPIVVRRPEPDILEFDKKVVRSPFYVNMGECYVNGLMHGEIAALRDSEDAVNFWLG